MPKGILPAAKTTLVVSQILLITAHVSPTLVDALLPLGRGTFHLLLSAISASKVA